MSAFNCFFFLNNLQLSEIKGRPPPPPPPPFPDAERERVGGVTVLDVQIGDYHDADC